MSSTIDDSGRHRRTPSGVNNANMFTPADGAAPRMRMYVFQTATTQATVLQPSGIAGAYAAAEAAFGPATYEVRGEVANTIPADACAAIANAGAIAGRIALVDRGGCDFALKAFNVQAAGAIGIVVVNNVPGAPGRMGVGANAGAVTIPSVHVAQSTGAQWRAEAAVTVAADAPTGPK